MLLPYIYVLVTMLLLAGVVVLTSPIWMKWIGKGEKTLRQVVAEALGNYDEQIEKQPGNKWEDM